MGVRDDPISSQGKEIASKEIQMKKIVGIGLLALAVFIGFSGTSFASSTYFNQFNTRYGTTGTALNTCSVCHTTAPDLNPYGNDFLASGHDFAAIETLDSDGDGFNNLAEIQARTFPGDPASKPAAADATAPTVTAFTIPATATSLTVSISSLTATDNVGVTGYMVTESSTAPAASAAGWTAAAPTSYSFTTAGAKTLYAWAKDAAGNVSASRSAAVTIAVTSGGQDTTAPTITSFSLPATSTSLAVSITSFTATDNVGVTGYMVKEASIAPAASTAGWSATAPASYSFAAAGTKTLYAWVKDAAGNVSASRSATVNVNTGTGTNPPPTSPPPTGQTDMTLWVGHWFKTNIRLAGYFNEDSHERDGRESNKGYLKIDSWDPANQTLQANLYGVEDGKWWVMPLALQYTSGSSLEFEASSQATLEDLTLEFTIKIKGEEKDGVLLAASLEALGKYNTQVAASSHKHKDHEDDDANNGWFKISGRLIPNSMVPRSIVSQ